MPKVGVFYVSFLSSCYMQCSSIREEHLKVFFLILGLVCTKYSVLLCFEFHTDNKWQSFYAII